ncbi:MAG TPA: type II toxin-antitoxin system VapC family toxin [Vicinamibacterales bacterium]|nr:type II toxin-antitoxin system VapC family toxin [Vicinamibacterales bacterium]
MKVRLEEASTRRRLYLDTSAYLCILLAEEGWEALSEETDGAELLSSVILILEARRNLIRLAREGALKPELYKICIERLEQDTSLFVLRDLTLDLCQSPLVPAVTTPRSLDLAHLRSAVWFHAGEPIDRFVTLDESQEQAARELGLPV